MITRDSLLMAIVNKETTLEEYLGLKNGNAEKERVGEMLEELEKDGYIKNHTVRASNVRYYVDATPTTKALEEYNGSKDKRNFFIVAGKIITARFKSYIMKTATFLLVSVINGIISAVLGILVGLLVSKYL